MVELPEVATSKHKTKSEEAEKEKNEKKSSEQVQG
jgi:hypothetical protein